MAQDGEPLALAFPSGEGEPRVPGRRDQRAVVVHDELALARPSQAGRQPRQRQADEHGERAVVGVQVLERRGHEQRRSKAPELADQDLGQVVAGLQQALDALVGVAQEAGLPGRDAQAGQGRHGLAAPPLAPALAIGRTHPPAVLGGPLGPRIVLAVGDEQHPHLGLDRQGALEQPAGGEGLVVRMGGEDQDPVGAGQGQRFGHDGAISMGAGARGFAAGPGRGLMRSGRAGPGCARSSAPRRRPPRSPRRG